MKWYDFLIFEFKKKLNIFFPDISTLATILKICLKNVICILLCYVEMKVVMEYRCSILSPV